MGLVSPLRALAGICAFLTGTLQGKTLTMIALILATNKDVPTDFSRTTLISTPAFCTLTIAPFSNIYCSCPAFCPVELGIADQAALYFGLIILLHILRQRSECLNSRVEEVRRSDHDVPSCHEGVHGWR